MSARIVICVEGDIGQYLVIHLTTVRYQDQTIRSEIVGEVEVIYN